MTIIPATPHRPQSEISASHLLRMLAPGRATLAPEQSQVPARLQEAQHLHLAQRQRPELAARPARDYPGG